MNKNSIEKERLINQILLYYDRINLYKYDLNTSSGVLTNKCIPMIWSMYNASSSLYSFVFGDFNKLGELNKKYGREQMNNAINTILSKIVDCLPTDAIISKYTSGDEYCIILPDKSKKQAQEYIDDIYKELGKTKEMLLGLSITFNAEDNTKVKEIFELFKKTSMAVTEIKIKNDNNFSGRKMTKRLEQNDDIVWRELNKKIVKSMKNFIEDLRIGNDIEISKSNLRQIMFDYKKNILEALNYNYENEIIETLNPYEDKLVNPEQAKIIYDSLFSREDMYDFLLKSDIKTLEEIWEQSKEISEQLTREHLSGLYTKSVYRRQIVPTIAKNKTKYQIAYFSLSGIKLMNKAHSYNYTDRLIKQRTERLVQLLNNKVKISENVFCNEINDTVFIDQGGGNYCAFIPKTKDISEQVIKDIVDEINLDEGLELVYSYSDDLKKNSPNSIINQIRELRDECVRKKVKIKTNRILNRDCNIKLAFIHELKDVIEFFKSNIPSEKIETEKIVFIKNIITALLEELNECRQKDTAKQRT